MFHADMRIGRRSALLGLASAVSLGRASLAVAAAATERRFVVVILRGALDGLAAVPPYGDPALAALRAPLVPGAVGTAEGMLDLGGFYGLHPALAPLQPLYAAGELLVAHAVAGDWRVRSHFEAQDFLESGVDQRLDSGWLNRVVQALPRADQAGGEAIAVGQSVPLLLRGQAAVGSWMPHAIAEPPAELYAQVAAICAHDRLIGPAVASGLRERGFTDEVLSGQQQAAPRGPGGFPVVAAEAARLLASPQGPRIAAMEIGGWDTHQAQANRLKAPLTELASGLVALRDGMGSAWGQTVVLAMTEFGRTVRVNGTAGTDHGTATVAFAAGGAVAGGRVLADWPGLADNRLLDGRDLQPTNDLRALAKGLLGPHLGLSAASLTRVFPGSVGVAPLPGLLRA
jgi:uncharacterized protein (DUF1501 family)